VAEARQAVAPARRDGDRRSPAWWRRCLPRHAEGV